MTAPLSDRVDEIRADLRAEAEDKGGPRLMTCPSCHGKPNGPGRLECDRCDGRGVVEEDKK
jgi:DnaJ-class molecular chaperone